MNETAESSEGRAAASCRRRVWSGVTIRGVVGASRFCWERRSLFSFEAIAAKDAVPEHDRIGSRPLKMKERPELRHLM